MKDLSAYYEIARLITAELSETITPEEKGRLNVWLAEDERHYMRYCRIRERLKRGEGENVFRNPERVREDMEKLKKKLSGNKRHFLLSGNYFWRYGTVAVFMIGIAIGLIQRPWEDRSSEMTPMAQQPADLPGSNKAVLTLASGEQVHLEEWCRDSLWKDGTLIRKRKGEKSAKVVLAAGLPLTGFGREKQKFREYLFRKEQPVRFFYEGERYEIQIEDVKLFPQGYSALALYPDYLKDEPSVLLVDIGGWTVDLMRLDNAVPNAATCRSLELGVIRCMDEIREQVRRNTGLSVTETQIERVLHGKSSSMPVEVVSLIEKQGRLYIEKILSAITEAGFDLRAVPSVFMGGGAVIFKHRVSTQDRLCRPIYLTDVHANAAGYERIVGQMRTL